MIVAQAGHTSSTRSTDGHVSAAQCIPLLCCLTYMVYPGFFFLISFCCIYIFVHAPGLSPDYIQISIFRPCHLCGEITEDLLSLRRLTIPAACWRSTAPILLASFSSVLAADLRFLVCKISLMCVHYSLLCKVNSCNQYQPLRCVYIQDKSNVYAVFCMHCSKPGICL
jgi:hypothetical protein